MICHICHSEAVGQCKDCGKFYCPDHGDIRCVKCRGGEKADPFPDLEPRPGPAKAGLGCYVCQGTAVGACTVCGKFYCPEHGGKQQWGCRRGLCEPCRQNQNTRTQFAVILALVLLAVGIVGIFGARSTPQHATIVEEMPAVAAPAPPPGSAPLLQNP